MGPTPKLDQLPEDARHAVNALDKVLQNAIDAGRPIDALIAIRLVGDLLSDHARAAANAAADGAWTWADVGDALGVSKQAAHQRLSAKIDEKRAKLDAAERAGHEKISAKFAEARAHLERHPADDRKKAAVLEQIDQHERERHEKLTRKTRGVHERLDRYQREHKDT